MVPPPKPRFSSNLLVYAVLYVYFEQTWVDSKISGLNSSLNSSLNTSLIDPWIQDPRSKIFSKLFLDPSQKSWIQIQDPRSKIFSKLFLDPSQKSWIQIQDPRSKIFSKLFLDPSQKSWIQIQDPRSKIFRKFFLDPSQKSWIQIQDPRSKIFRKLFLDPLQKSWIQIQDPRSKIFRKLFLDPLQKSWIQDLPHFLVKMLLEDELLSSWAGKTCPRCGKGTLSKLDSGDKPRHRCSYWKCHVYINPQHLHPLFLDSRGSSCVPLQTQAALLFLKINNVPHATIHRVLGINHKAIEDLANRLHALRKKYVEAKEKEIDFGSGVAWGDVEADETTFDRRNLGATAVDKSTPIAWEQWCGLVKRGHPETLVLHRLSPKMSETRAPGPGAIRKVEWTPLGNKWLKNKKIVLHTDAAKSYKCHIPGVVHDNVIHCKKSQNQREVEVAGT